MCGAGVALPKAVRTDTRLVAVTGHASDCTTLAALQAEFGKHEQSIKNNSTFCANSLVEIMYSIFT